RLTADLSVTGINHQMMFRSQLSGELQHVDSLTVFHARQRFRAKPFFSEETEPRAAHPVVHQRIGAGMTSITRIEAFLENFVELELERVDVPNAGCAQRHPLRLLFPELQEIKIKPAVCNFFGPCACFLRTPQQRKSQ